MRFTRGFRGRFKPALRTVNHCLGPGIVTVAGVESQTILLEGIDAPANRAEEIPAGALLTGLDIWAWATDATPVNGYHRCMLVFQPGATTYAAPIASWLDVSSPLTEEAIQIRQNTMQRFHQQYVITGAPYPLRWHCRWKGKKVIRESDDVIMVLQDQNVTNWATYCEFRYIT